MSQQQQPRTIQGTVRHYLARLFRQQPDGTFQEIPRDGAKAGDRCLMLGLDDSQLWMAKLLDVRRDGSIQFEDGAEGVVGDEVCDLLRMPRSSAEPPAPPPAAPG